MKRSLPVFLLVLLAPASSAADPEDDLARALRQERSGDAATALVTLDRVLQEAPESAVADDALFHAGRILEERLGKPAEALTRYRALQTQFPQSRLARRGASRVRALEAALSSGDEHLVELTELLRTRDADLPPAMKRMEALLDAPAPRRGLDLATWERATAWLASAYTRQGQPGRALQRWEAIVTRSHGRPAVVQALVAIGDLDVTLGRTAAAEEAYQRLLRTPGGRAAGARGLAGLHQARDRRAVAWALGAGIVVIVAALAGLVVRRAGWAALAPSTEVALFGPLLLLLLGLGAVAWMRADDAAPNAWQLGAGLQTIGIIALGGLVLAHVGAALARVVATPERRWVRVALPAGVGILSLLLVALTLETTGLGPFVIETLRTGAAR